MDESVVEESAPAAASTAATMQVAAVRDDQVQNAVQFLLHPKVQASSMDDRKTFLQKKGLTDEEIDEAVRVAQPRLDQMSKAQAVPKTPSPTLQGSTATQPSRTALNSSFSSRVAQGDDLPPVTSIQPPSTGASWGKILLASMAVVGLGSGLGVLAKKYLSDLVRTSEGFSRREDKKVSEFNEKLDEISSAMQKLHEALERNTKEVSDMNRRVSTLEAAPSLESVKKDILSTTQNMITSNSLSDLQQEVKALRTLIFNMATQNSRNALEEKEAEVAPAAAMKSSTQVELKPSTSGGGSSVPPGLPNARIFRNLANSGKVGQATSNKGSTSSNPKNNDDESRPSSEAMAAQRKEDEVLQTGRECSDPYSSSFKEVLDLVQQGGVPCDIRNVDDSPLGNSFAATPATKNPRRKPWEENRSNSQRAVDVGNEEEGGNTVNTSERVESLLEADPSRGSTSPYEPRDFLQEVATLNHFGRGPAVLKSSSIESGQGQQDGQAFSYLPTIEPSDGKSKIFTTPADVISQIKSESSEINEDRNQ